MFRHPCVIFRELLMSLWVTWRQKWFCCLSCTVDVVGLCTLVVVVWCVMLSSCGLCALVVVVWCVMLSSWAIYPPSLHYTSLHITSEEPNPQPFCTKLYYTSRYFTSLQKKRILNHSALNFTSLRKKRILNHSALNFTSLHFRRNESSTTLHFTSLHFTSEEAIPQPLCTKLHFTSLHFTSQAPSPQPPYRAELNNQQVTWPSDMNRSRSNFITSHQTLLIAELWTNHTPFDLTHPKRGTPKLFSRKQFDTNQTTHNFTNFSTHQTLRNIAV
jgi:hypothetical protein